MLTTNLRSVDGAVVLAVPPALLERLHLEPGATVSLTVEGERLVISATDSPSKPRYSLNDLLRASDYQADSSSEEQAWVSTPAAGRELL